MKDTLIGIDKNIGTDFIIGLISAISFIVLGSVFSIIGAIGIPSLSASVAGEIGKWIIIVIGASIFETFFFFEFVLDFWDNKFKNLGFDIPYFLAGLLTSVMFALFHFVAYSGSLSAGGGSFISAGIIGFGWVYLRKWTNSLLPLVISHAILNAWILSKLSVVIG